MPSLASRLDQLPSPRILVLGDLILDRYTFGNAERVSPEAPVLVLRTGASEVRLGGAASVARLLRGLDAEVVLAGVIGDDPEGRTLQSLANASPPLRKGGQGGWGESQLDSNASEGAPESLVLLDPTRPTTTKERFVGRTSARSAAGGQQILRVDHESREPISAEIETELSQAIVALLAGNTRSHSVDSSAFDALLISDYAKGVCTPRLLEAVIAAANARGIPVIVDPARGADFSRYRRATLVKPNRVEAELATGRKIRTPQDAVVAGQRLCRQYEFDATLITLDQEGMALAEEDESGVLFPTQAREVCDVTGAGDMALATLGLCLARTPDSPPVPLEDAIRIANIAAGLEVEKLGVTPVSRAELRAALLDFSRSQASRSQAPLGNALTEAPLQSANVEIDASLRAPHPAKQSFDTSRSQAELGNKDEELGNEEEVAGGHRSAGWSRVPSAAQLATIPKSEIPLSKSPPNLILTPAHAASLADSYRCQGKSIVFTNGCFDLLHAGHVKMLTEASLLGDVLFVAVNSDASLRRLKGEDRPIIPEGERALLLAALAAVNHVVIFDDDTPHRLLEQIVPDVLAKGGTTGAITGHEFVESYGGRVHRLGELPEISTTRILTRIRHATLPPFARGGQGGSRRSLTDSKASCDIPAVPDAGEERRRDGVKAATQFPPP